MTLINQKHQLSYCMSEELSQRDLISNPEKIGMWNYYNIGATTVKQLKNASLIRSIDYGVYEKKKVDGILVKNKDVIAVVEYKKPSNFNTDKKKEKAINQEIKVAEKLGAKLILATDTNETIWVNVATGNRIIDTEGNEFKENFDPKSESTQPIIESILNSINESNDQIKPKQLVNPTDLAKQIWQDIWSVSGATPENCLYTFVELFIFKYLSDLNVLKGMLNFYTLYDSYSDNTEEEVLETYANSIRPKIKSLFPQNEVDKTTIINGTIFVSKDQKAVKGYSSVFKKILIKFKNYEKLENIDFDFKSQIFESFLKESISKKNWGQFFTPLKVVKSVVEMAKDEIRPGIKICDPACGVGKFLLEPIASKLDQLYKIEKNKLESKITIHGFDKGFDKDEQKTIILAKANMLIYFSDLIKENPTLTTEFANLFNSSFILKTNSILGTLSEPVENYYDLIVTNPPYVTSGSSNLKDEVKKDKELEDFYKINAMGVEGLFMEWIVKALKPNGKAFIIVPDGIFNRQNDESLRKFILSECYLDGIISLPIKTFFTTPKKTYILCITKKGDNSLVQKDPVFTYLTSEIGESRDVYRFDIEQDDLTEAVTLYSYFKGKKDTFHKINSDPRCKIQPFENFTKNNHWSIDRWWTKEEEIELGIKEKDCQIDVREFGELVKDISTSMDEYSTLINEIAEKKKKVKSYNSIQLSNKSFFQLAIGKRVLKKDIVNNSEGFPIYSANVNKPVGFKSKSNIEDFSNNFVLWGIDGDFDFNFIPKNTPFVTTDHCGLIRLINEEIYPEYLMIELERVKHEYGFDRGLRASLANMKKVKVNIPYSSEGIDSEIQKQIINQYNHISALKKSINSYKNKILKSSISYDYLFKNKQTKEVKISDVFTSPPTNSGLKKIDVSLNKTTTEVIPVYSATMNENSIFGWVSKKSKWKKYQNVLTWNKDGSSGFVFYRKELFVPYEKVKLLKIKEEYEKSLSYEYLRKTIQKRLLEEGFGFNVKCSMEKVLKLSIQIPIDQNGDFDLKKQIEISQFIEKIDELKKSIVSELDTVDNSHINYID